MEGHSTNWTPGFIALAVAIAVAYLFVRSFRASSAASDKKPGDGASPEDLDERYRALLASLKEHAAGKHLMPEAQWQAEQTRLEQAAAAVLREKAGAKHEALKAQARAEKLEKARAEGSGFFAKNPALRGALVGGLGVGFFVVLGFVLTNQTSTRVDPPMQNRPPMAAAAKADPAKEIAALVDRAQKNPDDIDVLADVSGQLVKLQAFNEAYPIVMRASGLDPFHVQTRIWRAVLEAVDGQALTALTELEHLASSYPGAYKARLYAGLIALDAEQQQRALTQLEAYLVEAPPAEQPPFIAMSVQQLKAQLAQQQAPGLAPSPLPAP